MTFSW